jgi:maltose/moltooligosaccharide transporter
MDASINISMEPFRAFVGDMLPSEQRTMGFSMQSFFIGIGAIIASALPYILTNWFNISNIGAGNQIAPSVKLAFYLGGIVFFLAVLWTVLRTKEYSPEQLKQFESAERKTPTDPNKVSGEKSSLIMAGRCFKIGAILITLGIATTIPLIFMHVEKEVYILSIGLIVFGLFEVIAGLLIKKNVKSGFTEIVNDLNKMPKTMSQLAFVQFFSWFALFAMWIYTTSGVTSSKYDMKLDRITYADLKASIENLEEIPESEGWENYLDIQRDINRFGERFEAGKEVVATVRVAKFFTDTEKQDLLKIQPQTFERVETILIEYNKGADWVGVLMAVYNGFAAIMAFLIMWMARKISRKTVHSICMVVGAISMASFFFIPNPNLLLISELGIGLAWASILAMPYAILTGSLPSNKMGVYMGIFNFFIVIPQIVAASILGFCVQFFFDGQPIYALLLGGISWLLASLLVLFVQDKD